MSLEFAEENVFLPCDIKPSGSMFENLCRVLISMILKTCYRIFIDPICL